MSARPFSRLAFALAALAAVALPLSAHEIGAIEVRGLFAKGGEYRVDISVDPRHALPAGAVEAARQAPPIVGLDAATEREIGPWFRALAGSATLAFDGRPAKPLFEVVRAAGDPNDPFAAPAKPELRLRGRTPAGAKVATFRVDLPVGSFPVALVSEGEGDPVFRWTEAAKTSEPFPLAQAVVPPARAEVVRRYLALGYTHILPKGVDHILFVLGLFLLSLRLRPLLLQVTAFTVAHTLTLGLAMLGWVHLSPRIVEPLIAVSIVYVAVENLFARELKKSRIALVFCFGLLHGLGFAGVLSELGLPRSEFVPALLSFNAGVELGQLSVLAGAFLLVGALRSRPWYRLRVAVPASLAIAAVGMYWAIERVLG